MELEQPSIKIKQMKLENLLIALLFGATFLSCQNNAGSGNLETTVDSVSYVMGALDGGRVTEGLTQAKLEDVINMEIYSEAFFAAAKKGDLKIDPKANMVKAQNFIQKHRELKMKMDKDTTGTLPEVKAATETIDSISYILGANDGQGLIGSFSRAGIDTLISMDFYFNAFGKALAKADLGLVAEDHMPIVDNFFRKIQEERMKAEEAKIEAEFGSNKREGEEFLAKNKAIDGVTETASGLQYEVIKEGKGKKPAATNTVKVHYHGTLLDGTVFDSSVDRGEPATFPLNRVIKGWTEGLQYMTVGSKYKFYIPYDLAYGSRDQGNIKPFSMLTFEVELLEVVK